MFCFHSINCIHNIAMNAVVRVKTKLQDLECIIHVLVSICAFW